VPGKSGLVRWETYYTKKAQKDARKLASSCLKKTIIPSRKATKKYLEAKKMSNNLNKEELEILESYENDEWVSVSTPASIEKYKSMAKSTFKKNKRVNIRMSEMDLELLQERALIKGLPYQTLMSSVLHKFVTGRLTDKSV